MSKETNCLHCQLLDVVKAWAFANGVKDADQITHASGIHIMGSVVEVVMDIMAITTPAERREIYGFLFQQIMNAGLESGLIQSMGMKTEKPTIN